MVSNSSILIKTMILDGMCGICQIHVDNLLTEDNSSPSGDSVPLPMTPGSQYPVSTTRTLEIIALGAI